MAKKNLASPPSEDPATEGIEKDARMHPGIVYKGGWLGFGLAKFWN